MCGDQCGTTQIDFAGNASTNSTTLMMSRLTRVTGES